MQYAEGHIGRVFFVKIEHGEDFLALLQDFVERKGIASGILFFLGALAEGKLVTGPEMMTVPPVPHFEEIRDGWEIFGTGTILPGETRPVVHVHAGAGRGSGTRTGCLRETALTYLVVEVVILEIGGLLARRKFDQVSGLHLPVLGNTF
jgi:predicted DNA-binding protein with PD1-like motif